MHIVIDGKHYRERRGKLVEIPPQWVGKIPTDKTMRRRDSRQTFKTPPSRQFRKAIAISDSVD